MGRHSVWELVFLMVILKIPIVYLGLVVWYAIKAEPDPEEGAAVTARLGADDPGLRLAGASIRAASGRARTAGPRARIRASRARCARRAEARAPVSELGYETGGRSSRPSETVAGFLASLAIFISLISLAWHPLRLILPSILVALIAAAMAGRKSRLAFAAVMIAAGCFFFGLTIAVVTSRPLW